MPAVTGGLQILPICRLFLQAQSNRATQETCRHSSGQNSVHLSFQPAQQGQCSFPPATGASNGPVRFPGGGRCHPSSASKVTGLPLHLPAALLLHPLSCCLLLRHPWGSTSGARASSTAVAMAAIAPPASATAAAAAAALALCGPGNWSRPWLAANGGAGSATASREDGSWRLLLVTALTCSAGEGSLWH